jgi:hypothetical protein
MKKLNGVAVAGMMAVMTLAAGAQTSNTVKDDLFAGTEIFAKGATDVNEITMDPGTLGMVDGKDSKRAHNMVLSVVRTYTYDKPGMYRIEDVDAFRNKLNTGEWHCSVHTRSLKTGESTDVCNKQRTDDMKETAIITVEPKSLTFIHTIGKGNGYGGWSGSSYMMMPGGGMDPAMRAEMAIGMAEMHAQVAEMGAMNPGMRGLYGNVGSLSGLKMDLDTSLRGFTDGSVRKSLNDATKSFDELKKSDNPSVEKQPE